jgi:hypothetical protein
VAGIGSYWTIEYRDAKRSEGRVGQRGQRAELGCGDGRRRRSRDGDGDSWTRKYPCTNNAD